MTRFNETINDASQAKHLLKELGNTSPTRLQLHIANNLVRYCSKQLVDQLRQVQMSKNSNCIADRIARRQLALLTHSLI